MSGTKKMTTDLAGLRPGMVLTQNVATSLGNILLHSGTRLTSRLIEAIARYEISEFHVEIEDGSAGSSSSGNFVDWSRFLREEPLSDSKARVVEDSIERKVARNSIRGFRFDDVSREETEAKVARNDLAVSTAEAGELRAAAVVTCRRAFEDIAAAGTPRAMRRFTENLVSRGLTNPCLVAALIDLKDFDDYLIDHSIKTAVYSLLIGSRLGLDRNTLLDLTESALLHDVGMIRVPEEIWRKREFLTVAERLEVQKHVVHGADMLESVRGVPFWAGPTAYQHHERFDGQGYPKERKGKRICDFARIVGLADHYAAITAPRPFREKLHGYHAVSAILGENDSRFDPLVIRAFISAIGLYPVGSRVRLSDSRRGLVVAANPNLPLRPFVAIDDETFPIDLSKDRKLSISAAA